MLNFQVKTELELEILDIFAFFSYFFRFLVLSIFSQALHSILSYAFVCCTDYLVFWRILLDSFFSIFAQLAATIAIEYLKKSSVFLVIVPFNENQRNEEFYSHKIMPMKISLIKWCQTCQVKERMYGIYYLPFILSKCSVLKMKFCSWMFASKTSNLFQYIVAIVGFIGLRLSQRRS